jgi:hypothetical protein
MLTLASAFDRCRLIVMWNPFGKNKRSGRSSIRKRLLRDLLLMLAATSGSLLAAIFYAGESLREDLAVEQLQELARKTNEDFSGFFLPVENALRIAQGWGVAGDLTLEDSAALVSRFIPVLDNLHKASALVLGDTEGRSFYLRRSANGWTSRALDAAGNATWIDWSGPGAATAERQGKDAFDPRGRPWFQQALQAENGAQVLWTRPYLFFTEGVAGMTGALRFRPPGSNPATFVIGLDVPLKGLLAALAKLEVGNGGEAFITEADGAVLLPPTPSVEDSNGLSVSLSPQRFDAGAVFRAVSAWSAAGKPAETALEFTNNGAWWAWLQPLSGAKNGLWLGISVPETDFLAVLRKRGSFIILAGLLVLTTGLGLTLWLTRRYGRQLKAAPLLGDDAQAFEDSVLSLIHHGESPTLEFKSTLRTNLKTGKPGKEIELAWLKGLVGFLNTDGGVLLVGVDDEGDILGIDADQFDSEDKCLLHVKNLINQHIGAEYSKYLQTQIRNVQGKTLVAISCEKAAEPVFLMIGKNEEFHIRSGPSSIKLTPRQMLQHLNGR